MCQLFIPVQSDMPKLETLCYRHMDPEFQSFWGAYMGALGLYGREGIRWEG